MLTAWNNNNKRHRLTYWEINDSMLKYEFLEEAILKLFTSIFKVREHKLKLILELYRPTTENNMHYF